MLVPRNCALSRNDILNHCLKSALSRSCAFGKSSKSKSKQKSNPESECRNSLGNWMKLKIKSGEVTGAV